MNKRLESGIGFTGVTMENKRLREAGTSQVWSSEPVKLNNFGIPGTDTERKIKNLNVE